MVAGFRREARCCKKCGAKTTAPDPTIRGTSCGKNLASLLGGWFPTGRTLLDITDDIKDMFGEVISQNSVKTCVLALPRTP